MLLSEIAQALTCKHIGEDLEIVSMNNLSSACEGQLSFAEHKNMQLICKTQKLPLF